MDLEFRGLVLSILYFGSIRTVVSFDFLKVHFYNISLFRTFEGCSTDIFSLILFALIFFFFFFLILVRFRYYYIHSRMKPFWLACLLCHWCSLLHVFARGDLVKWWIRKDEIPLVQNWFQLRHEWCSVELPCRWRCFMR